MASYQQTISTSPQIWSPTRANEWYSKTPWLVGANFIPSDAGNQFEMWQSDTFNPDRIDKELGLAKRHFGMNTMRIFLQDQLWTNDSQGLLGKIDTVLDIHKKHGMKPSLTLFDSCWESRPESGPQRQPIPGIHNSMWVQSPGMPVVINPAEFNKRESYVKGIIGAFKNDDRVLYWDLWNEPCNTGGSWTVNAAQVEKAKIVAPLLQQTFDWARSVNPSQPLTSGVWGGDASATRLNQCEQVQLVNSDIRTFHSYSGNPQEFKARIEWLQTHAGEKRPVICTEYLARGDGNLLEKLLPIAKELKCGMINWGLVAGKTQTYLRWNKGTMKAPEPWPDDQVAPWHHDLLVPKGNMDAYPYRPVESRVALRLTEGETFAAYAQGSAPSIMDNLRAMTGKPPVVKHDHHHAA